jgi:hypothetical protein
VPGLISLTYWTLTEATVSVADGMGYLRNTESRQGDTLTAIESGEECNAGLANSVSDRVLHRMRMDRSLKGPHVARMGNPGTHLLDRYARCNRGPAEN